MTETEDFGWLVDRRSRIQQLLLRLYEFLNENRADLATRELQWPLFGLLVGAGFSLWRAAFLAEEERQRPDVLDHAEKFLERLLRDNAINYPQDRETRMWTVGYYLHNARFRLELILGKLSSDPAARRVIGLAQKEAFRAFHASEPNRANPRTQWDKAYEAAAESLNVLCQLARLAPNKAIETDAKRRRGSSPSR